ncbi:hypothetical protein AS594_08765 [Streptomyces agglomeratus]|uniref:Uncharacterized protein n=1 Tax=Streptomyces agglomeratus TaxID=285458 RepID=A0A1E5P4S4_9ACTN|nr:hypothetical protein AS594_08765 [Streptomyces agglomeratus]
MPGRDRDPSAAFVGRNPGVPGRGQVDVRACDHQDRVGVVEHEGDPVRRIARVYGYVRCPRLQHRQHRDHEVDRPWQRHGHEPLLARTLCGQRLREAA